MRKLPSTSRELKTAISTLASGRMVRSVLTSMAATMVVRSGEPNSRPEVRPKVFTVSTGESLGGVPCHTRSWWRTTWVRVFSSSRVVHCVGILVLRLGSLDR